MTEMIRINTQAKNSSHYNNDLESGPGSRLLAGTGKKIMYFFLMIFFPGYIFSLILFFFLDFIFREYFVGEF